MAHSNEQAENIDGWIMAYNRTDISGNVNSIDNPIMTMDDIPEPLTVCSAEEVMTDWSGLEFFLAPGLDLSFNGKRHDTGQCQQM